MSLKFHLHKKRAVESSVACFLIFKDMLILLHLFLFLKFFVRVSVIKEFATVIFERIFKRNMGKIIIIYLYFMSGK